MKKTYRYFYVLLAFSAIIFNSFAWARMPGDDFASFTKKRSFANGKQGQAEFDQSGFNFGLATEINGTFIVHQQTYGKSRLMPYSPSIKFAIRGMFGYNFDASEGVVLGVGYCGGGQNYHDNLDGMSYTKNVSLSYLQVPVMFKYVFTTEAIQTYTMAGLQIGFLTSSSVMINDSLLNPASLSQVHSSSSTFFQSSDIGFRLELGEDFMLADNMFLNLGLESYIGLPDMNTSDLRKEFVFHSNYYSYKKSSNFIFGIQVGIHYIIK